MKQFSAVLFTNGNVAAYQVFDKEDDARKYVATYVGPVQHNGYNYSGGGVYELVAKAEKPVPIVTWVEVKKN